MAATSKKTTTRASKSTARKPNRSNIIPGSPHGTKTDYAISLLRRKNGASLAELTEALGWQEHSVRSLLSAGIAKNRELPLTKSKEAGEPARYFIAASKTAKD
jgi:hypothetical protein